RGRRRVCRALDGPDHGAVSGRGRLWRVKFRLVGRPIGTRSRDDVERPDLFAVHRPVLFRASPLGSWRFAVRGRIRHGRRRVVGRGAGDGSVAGGKAADVGGRHRGGGERRIRADRRSGTFLQSHADLVAVGNVGRGGA